jgi:hypothetical protein
MRRFFTALGLLAMLAPTTRAEDAKGLEFFEKKIRPVLAEHCYSCHSTASKKQRGGLLLDTREALLTGGDTGPALVPGDPAKSLIVQVLRYQGDLKMPPKSKLPENVVNDFATWVKMGAPDPRVGGKSTTAKNASVEEGRKFWSYQPVQKPAAPAVKDKAWGTCDIDAFILAPIEAKNAKPAPDASPRVLVRRLYFDLIGLPPRPEEINAFEKAAAKDLGAALAETVDRLLQSPEYGERWGRHWLDVARYAESLTLRGFVLKEAWRYRDYVIDAFNEDVPFDRFVREQLAGDLLPASSPSERRRQMTAAGFLTLGNNNLEEQDKKLLRMDVVDEQLETVGRAFLGQTIGCARCHDHKFDPIPTADYYALAGIFRNTKTIDTSSNVAKWLEMALPPMPGQQVDTAKHDREVADLTKQIAALKASLGDSAAVKNAKVTKSGKSIDIKSLPGIVVDDTQAMKVGAWTASSFSGPFIGEGYLHDGNSGRGEKSLTFQAMLPHSGKYEVRFAYTSGTNRADKVEVMVASEEGEKTIYINQKQKPPIDEAFVSLGQYQFEKTGQCYVLVSNEGANGHVTADAVLFIPVKELAEVKPVKPSSETPALEAKAKAEAAAKLKKLEEQLKKLKDEQPGREMVMGIEDEKKIEDIRIHIRGSVANLGTPVKRGFLQVATVGPAPVVPANQSGRRELADWIASPHNPLTARIMVNRVWHWLMGDGIVRTVDNFGSTGERPSHPELLDYLASRFVEDGWSVKKLVRAIVLSRTYRQASGPVLAGDPENRLFAHANRRRLDAECIRDAMLAVSGQLNLERGGPGYKSAIASDYNYKHEGNRRSVYAPVFRNALPEIFDAFDFADPSVSTGRRSTTTVAPQALFMMNNPFVLQQAQASAKKLLADGKLTDAQRVARAYEAALGRPATDAERRLAELYFADVGADSKERQDAWTRFMQNLFASIDFRFVN